MADGYSAFYGDYYGGTFTHRFSGPTVDVRWDTGERLTTLFSKMERGLTVIQNGAVFTSKRFPSQVELREADAYWLGGHVHDISETEAEALEDAGYEVEFVETYP